MTYIKVGYINYFEVAIVEDVLKNDKIEYFFKDSICKAHGFEFGTGLGNFAPKILFIHGTKVDAAKQLIQRYII